MGVLLRVGGGMESYLSIAQVGIWRVSLCVLNSRWMNGSLCDLNDVLWLYF